MTDEPAGLGAPTRVFGQGPRLERIRHHDLMGCGMSAAAMTA